MATKLPSDRLNERRPWRLAALIVGSGVVVAGAGFGTVALASALNPSEGIAIVADAPNAEPTPVVLNVDPVAVISPPAVAELAVTLDASASTDSDGTIASYAWNFGDGSNAAGVTASHAYAAAGTYTVTMTVSDDGGGWNSTTAAVTVAAPAPPPPAAPPAPPAAGARGSLVPFIPSTDPNNANGGDYIDPSIYCDAHSASTVGGVPVCD